MLKTNVVAKTYRCALRNRKGVISTTFLTGESVEAVKLKIYIPYGWELLEVVPA